MNEQELNVSNKTLTSIKEKLFAGKAAFESDELEKLCKQIENEMNSAIKNQSVCKNDEISKEWLEIFESISIGDFADTLFSSLDKENFYDFGNHLIEEKVNYPENDIIVLLMHAYLNLFRTTSLLKKIYKEKKWQKLVNELISASNYNVNILFNQRVSQYKDKTLFKILKGKNINKVSWHDVNNDVLIYARAFYNLIKNYDLDNVKISFLLENDPHMPLLDLACLTTGIVNVMIPANSVMEHIEFILNQTESPIIFVHDEKQLLKVKSVKNNLQFLDKVVMLYGNSSEDWVISFNAFIESGAVIRDDQLDDLREKITMDSLATIMYTSGTTGEPKGIMFSQMNIIYKRFCRSMALPAINDKDRFLSYLPLFHTFGRWLEMMGCVFWGAEYCFMEDPSVDTMISNMNLVQPTVFISIPKKWSQLYDSINVEVDIETDEHDIIKATVEKRTGGQLKWGLSAAGYLPPDIFKFFQQYEIELMSGFGMTEATGGITMTPPFDYKENSLGPALPGIEIKLGEDGEILIRGPYVMMGYYGKAYEETFMDDGWLATGDVMKMDEEGFIQIIDRKKEIYKNIKGETIAPQKIENYFREFENVKQVFLVGDHRAFNTVLIYPNQENGASPLQEMNEKQKQEYFSSLIVTVNKFLAPFERILDFRIIDRPFSLEHGELTPKGTYKRRMIEQNFDDIIETMYEKSYIAIIVNDIEVRVPNWFLREKGSLSRDIISGKDGLEIPKISSSLAIGRIKSEENVFRIGTYNYQIKTTYIDMQPLLTNPLYWIGNKELVEFSGEAIYQWYRRQLAHPQIKYFSSNRNIKVKSEWNEDLDKMLTNEEYSLKGLHISALMLQSKNHSLQMAAAIYSQKVLLDETNYNYQFALEIASRPNLTPSVDTRRELFKAATGKLYISQFTELLTRYISEDSDFINEDIINSIVSLRQGKDLLVVFEKLIQSEINKVEERKSFKDSPLSSLFNLLHVHSEHHPTNFKRISGFVMRHAVFSSYEPLRQKAESVLNNLQQGLRNWLGRNQTVSVDMETGKEYGWEEVLIFEDGIDLEDRIRMRNALIKTPVLREAIFLFSKGVFLRLDNILPGGVWISHLKTKAYKSIYRVTLQTRFQGAFDVTLHLAHNLPPADIRKEIKWLILPTTTISGERLLPKFGGYWEDYELWTEEFVPRDSVDLFIQKTVRQNDEIHMKRLQYLWPYFVWNAAAAYLNFWKLSNYQIELAEPQPINISIPTHDYQTGTLLYSVSKRIESESVSGFLKNFYIYFVKQTEEDHPFLKKESIWNYIFSGIIEVEGEQYGLNLLKEFDEELKLSNEFPDKEITQHRLKLFIEQVEKNLYIPQSLFFAIKRFHRWFELNVDAAFTAQAEMLYELYDTYQLFKLENPYPSTRTVFFLETAFIDSDKKFKKSLIEIATKQHSGEVTKDASLKLISGLQTQFNLTEKEKFFLARLNYPYLKPTDSATLLKVSSETEIASNLVVQFTDNDNNPFLIRNPISPKEISRLHQLFFDSNLMVHFRPEHHFLVAISERGFIIGGLFYLRTSDDSAHMDKIVVSDRYRRKGISEALMSELFNRLKSEHISHVTTGFFRPEYFYKFGFKIERKYSGLVKNLLENEEKK
jgi:long-subunit acyl-CoA synthetase (AMP-forming)/GNAT superfamily N-acetyltransferase